MKSTRTIVRGVKHRAVQAPKLGQLEFCSRLADETVWIDYGWLRLPNYSDGDERSLLYHIDGAAWRKYERDVLISYVGHGAVAIDIGADLGFVTALHAGYRFHVEPVLENCHNGQNFIAIPV